MKKIIFEENHIHSSYSDGENTLVEIFDYNNLHDKLDLIISDHVDKNTDWFSDYAEEIKRLRLKYNDFSIKIGCEVKIVDESGELNTSDKILNEAEIVLGSVHHFQNIKSMPPASLLEQEYKLTKLLAENKKIDILAHPFGMYQSFFHLEPPIKYIENIYKTCVKNKIKFEFSSKYAGTVITSFVNKEIEKGNIDNFSFGSDAHQIDKIGNAAFKLAKKVNILVTGAGAGVGQSIIKAAKLSKVNKKIVVVDNSFLAAGMYRADAAYLVPLSKEKGYIEKIIGICKKEKIDIIFVGTDIELPILAKNKKKIESATKAILMISNPKAVAIADDKWLTTQFLRTNKFPYPVSSLTNGLTSFLEKINFPIIIKPRIGARSIGFFVVKDDKELKDKMNQIESPIIQEYLSSEDDEYTCSSLFYNGECYGVLTMKRWLRNGDTYKAIIKNDLKLEKFIAEVGKKLKIFGPCNFQLRKTKKGPVIFEINCRFSGTTGTASYLGFNVVNALLQRIAFKRSFKPLSFKESYMFRYWNEVFVNKEDIESLKEKKYIIEPKSDLNIF
jgi:carbamoyl-phosphate synthase large subunit